MPNVVGIAVRPVHFVFGVVDQMEKRGKVLELGVSGNVETAYGLFADLFVHVAGGFEHAVDHVGVVGVAEDLDVLPIIKIIKRNCGADAD